MIEITAAYLASQGLSETFPQRFWNKVRKTDCCWMWIGNKLRSGYGIILASKKRIAAHRASWILQNGPIPEGMFVCHHCDQPKCVRGDHLFLGDSKANHQDACKKGRNSRGEKHGMAKLTEEQILEIRKRYKLDKLTCKVIAKQYGVSACAIVRVVSGRDWKHITKGVSVVRPISGESHPFHKLTEEGVIEIRTIYKRGNTMMKDIACKFGVDITAIWKIIHRKTWAHI